MTLPFYKLHIAGNGFVLIDAGQVEQDLLERRKKAESDAARADSRGCSGCGTGAHAEDGTASKADSSLSPSLKDPLFLRKAGRALCDRRYGVGASGVIFLWPDNSVRVINQKGEDMHRPDDALLCAARYAYDSGRAFARAKGHPNLQALRFMLPRGEVLLDVLGAHEFRLALGAPFSMPGGIVIDPETPRPLETLEIDGIGTGMAAVHAREDTVIAFPRSGAELSWETCVRLVQKAFPDRRVQTIIAQAVTAETLSIKTHPLPESGACAAAAASLTAAACAGMTGMEALVLFTGRGVDSGSEEILSPDRGNSRRLGVQWDAKANELYVVGSGGYLFEGRFDLP